MPRTSGLLARIVPPNLVGAEADQRDSHEPLWAEELALSVDARPVRVRELAAGRSCARRALAALGAPVTAVLADSRRVPQWPVDVVGSITHTGDYAAAVVGWRTRVRAVGLDAEHVERVRPEVMPLVATRDELVGFERIPDSHRAFARALVFSAKEAAYKCQFPITGEVLDFLDLAVELDELSPGRCGSFRVHPRTSTAARAFSLVAGPIAGRFIVAPPLVVTLAVLASPYSLATENSGK